MSVTLENLLGLSLEAITPSREQTARLLAAAERNLQDASLDALSNENRFDAAYKAVMQLAMAALQANGFRTLKSRPGHHQTAIQSLPKTIGLPVEQMLVFDALRKQRHLADYSGELISDAAVIECIDGGNALLAQVKAWLHATKPALV
jgi:hypothetical protein